MVKLDYLDIQLDSQQHFYYAGQQVRGAIAVSLGEPVKVAGIFISLIGEARTSWVNKVSDKIFETVETYVNDRIKIPYLEQVSDGRLLVPGAHSVPFALSLPSVLPSSFDGDYGYVRYKIVAAVQLDQSSETELISEKIVNIIAVVHPENVSQRQVNIGAEEQFEIVECCSAHGSLEMSISAERSCYLAGKPILVDVRIANRTRGKKMPTLLFIQEAFFQSKSRYESVNDTKTLNRVVESIALDTVESGKTLKKQIAVDVPVDLQPTSIGGGSGGLISLKYKLKLSAGSHFELILPVGIASVPSTSSNVRL